MLPCAKGSEQVLQQEAQALGLQESRVTPAAVSGTGDLQEIYRLCLWSRVASRVLLVLANEKIENPDDLYALAKSIDWSLHIAPESTFAVRFTGQGQGIRNTQFGALKVKDAIVDELREVYKRRPDVDAKNPDVAVDVHLHRGWITLSLDLSGGALHERGYRQAQGAAPMKETLAATMLYRAGWAEKSHTVETLLDPMCGAGTLLLEAILMAADIAPGLYRAHWGFTAWQSHVPAVWRQLVEEAKTRREQGLAELKLNVLGFDENRFVVQAARENAERLGLQDYVKFSRKDVMQLRYAPTLGESGLLISNPPYGERLGSPMELIPLYAQLGALFKTFPADWSMTLIASDMALIQRLRLRADKQYQAFNGRLEVRILNYLRAAQPEDEKESVAAAPQALSEQAEMFANRLAKNDKKLAKWARKVPTDAWRVYDKDMPEYAVAVDIYGDYVVVQEYAPPKTIDATKARQRLYDVLQVVPETLGIDAQHMVVKTRERQAGKAQYNPLEKRDDFLIVQEGAAQYWVNLRDYLDTGLFLDHRPMRRRVYQEAKEKRVLNLFCYTATVSVQAALGGAAYTTSVDLSQTYLDWAQRNFDLNRLSDRHRLQKADVMAWLTAGESQFDLIFCDPPTFSNTKKENRVFDVQRDHQDLITRCMRRLAPGGTLYFSTNYRGFKLDAAIAENYRATDISAQTLDPDFIRQPRIHRVWQIQREH